MSLALFLSSAQAPSFVCTPFQFIYIFSVQFLTLCPFSPLAYSQLLELVEQGITAEAIMEMLKAAKDAKIRGALAQPSGKTPSQ